MFSDNPDRSVRCTAPVPHGGGRTLDARVRSARGRRVRWPRRGRRRVTTQGIVTRDGRMARGGWSLVRVDPADALVDVGVDRVVGVDEVAGVEELALALDVLGPQRVGEDGLE